MKRNRGRKPGQKNASASSVANDSPKTSASPSTDENGSADQTDHAPVNSGVASEPDLSKLEKPSVSNNPADVPYVKPKVGAVYGRVRVKLKSTRVLEPHQSSSDAQTPNNADKSGNKVPEGVSEIAVEKDNVLSDGQTSESRGSDSDKLARKVGSIKIRSSVLSSVHDATQDRKANLVGDTLPNKQETVLENKESEDSLELRNLPELEVKQPPPERRCDEKELAAALEVIKKVMKMDAAEPFNTPVDPVALGIPDYFDVIDTPMDFGTICQDLEHGNKYMNSEDVYKDVQFIWDNCTKYNSKGDYIMELMKRVKKAFMKNWLAAGLYSDMPDNGGNENTNNEDAMLASQEKGHPKSKSKHKRRRQGIDSHKYDCTCAVCNVTRRRKEKDEYSAAANENETIVMNSNLSEQHNLEGNSHVNNPGSHDATPCWAQPPQTDAYKEIGEGGKGKRVTVSGDILQRMEMDTTGNQMEDHGKRFNYQPSDLVPPDYGDEVSRQYSEEEEEVEYKDLKRQEELSTQPNDDYTVAHHQKAPVETNQDVEMQDFPIQQENHSVLELFASLFPSNQRSVFRGPHSLFHRQVYSRESPIHAAIASIMKP